MFRITNRGCRGCLLPCVIDRRAVNTKDLQLFQFYHTAGSFATRQYRVCYSCCISLEECLWFSRGSYIYISLYSCNWLRNMQQLGEMLSTSASQYINPDYYNPLPTTVRRVLFIYFFKTRVFSEMKFIYYWTMISINFPCMYFSINERLVWLI